MNTADKLSKETREKVKRFIKKTEQKLYMEPFGVDLVVRDLLLRVTQEAEATAYCDKYELLDAPTEHQIEVYNFASSYAILCYGLAEFFKLYLAD